MTEWVSQSEARRLLASMGDSISQPALSQYLAGHPEVARQDLGPGKPQLVDFAALKRSRATRMSRGPSSTPLLDLAAEAETPAPVAASAQPRQRDELGERKAQADTQRAEFDARRARILAEEAEGALIRREEAVSAFMAIGVAVVRALEDGKRQLIEDVRAADDIRAADLVMRKYIRAVRAALASDLTTQAALADPDLAQAAE